VLDGRKLQSRSGETPARLGQRSLTVALNVSRRSSTKNRPAGSSFCIEYYDIF